MHIFVFKNLLSRIFCRNREPRFRLDCDPRLFDRRLGNTDTVLVYIQINLRSTTTGFPLTAVGGFRQLSIKSRTMHYMLWISNTPSTNFHACPCSSTPYYNPGVRAHIDHWWEGLYISGRLVMISQPFVSKSKLQPITRDNTAIRSVMEMMFKRDLKSGLGGAKRAGMHRPMRSNDRVLTRMFSCWRRYLMTKRCGYSRMHACVQL